MKMVLKYFWTKLQAICLKTAQLRLSVYIEQLSKQKQHNTLLLESQTIFKI